MRKAITEETSETFKHPLGYVNYYKVVDDKQEYAEDNDPIWSEREEWIAISLIEATVKKRGDGITILKDFLKKFTSRTTGILANPSPEDPSLSFEKLRDWYEKLGFERVDKYGTTLKYTI